MGVKVYDGNNLLWSIDRTGKVMSGTTSVEYVTNGTQQKIVDILKEAMLQAECELSFSANVDRTIHRPKEQVTQEVLEENTALWECLSKI